MLRKTLLPATTCILKKTKSLKDALYCLHRNSYIDSKQSQYANTTDMKEKFEHTHPEASGKRKKSVLNDQETLDTINHLRNVNPDMINLCPNQLMKLGAKDTNVLYLIDRDAATKFVHLIKNDFLQHSCFVAELNPGFGILTTELLKAGAQHIHLYEAKKEFQLILNELCNIYPGKLDVRNFNLIKISQLLYIDRTTDANNMQEVLQGIGNKEWEDVPCMQVIGATSTKSFFRHLVYSLLFRNCLMLYGRPIFYVAVPPSLWHKFSCGNNDYNMYTSSKVMFQALFNCKFLGTLNRKAFLPWPRKSKIRNSLNGKIAKHDYEEMFVVKLEPKVDIYSQFSQGDWIKFWYFIRHNMRKRCSRVIPEMEKWVPGCGVRLIAKNYTIFTQFGELTPDECVKLFQEFKSWPEYQTCNFLTSMSNSLNMHNEPALLELQNYEMQE